MSNLIRQCSFYSKISKNCKYRNRLAIHKVEAAAQAVLDCREIYTSKGKSLANLYAPLSISPDLKAAHDVLDKAEDGCYGKTKFTSDAKRVGYLFELYDGVGEREKIKI